SSARVLRAGAAGALAALAAAIVACGSRGPAPAPPGGAAPDTPGPAASPAPPAGGATGPAALLTDSFGGERWGFAEASSASGRHVVLRRFTGEDPPRFGHHGETAEEPEVTVFDRVTGQERRIDDLIDVAPSRRFMLVLADGAVWLLDGATGDWAELEEADMEEDGNRCLPPRQATFSARGTRIAWVTAGASSLALRDLATGDQWSLPAGGRLWRGWPLDDARGAVLAELPADSTGWPVQNTSCACRWCNRFALSFGFYGWGGPSFAMKRVDQD